MIHDEGSYCIPRARNSKMVPLPFYIRNFIAQTWLLTKYALHVARGLSVTVTPSSNAPSVASTRSAGATSAATRVLHTSARNADSWDLEVSIWERLLQDTTSCPRALTSTSMQSSRPFPEFSPQVSSSSRQRLSPLHSAS